jgi:hypothetical protein
MRSRGTIVVVFNHEAEPAIVTIMNEDFDMFVPDWVVCSLRNVNFFAVEKENCIRIEDATKFPLLEIFGNTKLNVLRNILDKTRTIRRL